MNSNKKIHFSAIHIILMMTLPPGHALHSTQITGTTLASPCNLHQLWPCHQSRLFVTSHMLHHLHTCVPRPFICTLPSILSSGDSLDGTDPASSSYQATLYLSPFYANLRAQSSAITSLPSMLARCCFSHVISFPPYIYQHYSCYLITGPPSSTTHGQRPT